MGTGRWRRALFTAASLAVACSTGGPELESPLGRTSEALTTAQQRVLGFEAPLTDWSLVSVGTRSESTTANQGTKSLGVKPNGWTELKSIKLSSLGAVSGTVSFDLRQPSVPTWGEAHLILVLPSKGISYQDLGTKSLPALPAGSFKTLTFSLPSSTVAALSGTYSDLELHVVVNAPALGSPYLIDNLVFSAPPGGTGGSAGGGSTGGGASGTGGGGGTAGGTGGVTTTLPLSVTLPAGQLPRDVVIAGDESVVLGDRSTLERYQSTSFSSAVSNGTLGINLGVDGLSGDLWSKGDVILRGTNITNFFNVHGNVTTAGAITLQNNAKIAGASHDHTSFSTQVNTRNVNFVSSTAPISIGPDAASARIDPGAYGDVHIYSRSRVKLAAGAYYFGALSVEPDVELVLENSQAPVYLFVKNQLLYHGKITEQATGPMAANVLLGYFGTAATTLETPFIGTIYAPNATLTLATVGSPGHQGAFFARRVVVSPDVTVTHRPFPSQLIGSVDVSTTTPCENQSVTVTVHVATTLGDSSSDPFLVSIDGRPAVLTGDVATADIQRVGKGPRRVVVVVKRGHQAETRSVDIDVKTCSQKYPRVVVSPTKTPYEVDFTLTNPEQLTGAGRVFVWSFGDGTSAETPYPHVTHSYTGSLDSTTPEIQLGATATVRRTGQADVSVKKTVVIPNIYALGASRGYVQPPVTAAGPLKIDGSGLVGSFSLRNIEPNPITFTQRVVQKHFCDPDQPPTSGVPEAINIQVAGGATYTESVGFDRHDFRENVCAVSVYLVGKSSDNLTALASAHFRTPARPLLTQGVDKPEVRDFLNQLVTNGLVTDPNRITTEDLLRLKLEGRIPSIPELPNPEGDVLAGGDELLGQPCDPDDLDNTQFPTMTCQATNDWEITPPVVRNALKGDVIIVSACETIGGLLRKVTPRQFYSHEGIFVKNYSKLAESTAAEERILSSVQGIDDALDPDKLKFAWPGAQTQPIASAFSQQRKKDPEGKVEVLETFAPEATRCRGDTTISPPLVIRPLASEDSGVRDALHAAADFASTASTHYRWFGYSQANIAFDADRNFDGGNYRQPGANTPPTVSASFIWWTMRNANVPLEGNALEPLQRPFFHFPGVLDERDLGAMLPPEGALGEKDGLYLYTEAERAAGARYIYDTTYDQVGQLQDKQIYDKLGWSGDFTAPMLLFLTEGDAGAKGTQRDAIASQFVNCFGYDLCGAANETACPCTQQVMGRGSVTVCPPDMTSKQHAACRSNFVLDHPGTGVAVSPDNFLFWDVPDLGYFDYASYESGVFRRKHVWTAAEGTGTCSGKVVLEDNTPVEGALVILQNSTAPTDADGNFTFSVLNAGSYEVRAQKEIDTVLRWDSDTVEIPPGGACTPVTLVLSVDGPFVDLKPVEVVTRKVSITGNLHLLDDDVGKNPKKDFFIDTECVVSPANRDVKLNTVALVGTDNPCVGGEVSAGVQVTCTLDPEDLTNTRVITTMKVAMIEGDTCHGGGSVLDDPESATATHGPDTLEAGGSIAPSILAQVEGGDHARLTLTITNNAGDTIVINPIKEENRRKVTFDGAVRITDDDWGDPSESESFEFHDTCFVDPLDTEDEIEWSECVGDEVRAELRIKCSLSSADAKEVSVSTTAKLFEETTCLNSDEDGSQFRATSPLPACEDGCPDIFLNSPQGGQDLVVNNTDEGGDRVTLTIKMHNLQQSAGLP